MVVELLSDIMITVHAIVELIPIMVIESSIIVMYPDITDVVDIDIEERKIFS